MEPPDALEKPVRFGCGFIAGLVSALSSTLIWTIYNRYYFAAFCLGAAVACGYAAMKLGDRFWLNTWWWPW